MISFSLFMAIRYIRGAVGEKNIALMVRISLASIFIGSFALALVMAIMNGFEKVTHEKMQGVHPQIMMRSPGSALNEAAIKKVLYTEFPEIEAVSATAVQQIIVQHGTSDAQVIVVKAIEPEEERVTAFNNKIIASLPEKKSLASLVASPHHIVIGTKLAQLLDVTIGDTITILYSPESLGKKISLTQSTAVVSGMFSTGIEDFDVGIALVSFAFFETLFGQSPVSQMHIKLKHDVDEKVVIATLKERFGQLEVYSWKDLYPALVESLILEKYAMFLILVLIILVATMNIVALLFMHITQKRSDIALLAAMGTSLANIKMIFISIGTVISGIACLAGLIAATGASWLLETYPIITLPDVYYVSHLPARMEFHLLLFVFCTIMILSIFASWIPLRSIKTINIAQILRFEA